MSDIKAAATVLTDERIDRAIMKSALFDNAFPTNDALHDFARWIEREVLAQAGVTAEPEGLAQSEKPHDLTIREAFDAVGGWMNGGEMGYPSFGSFEALSIYTTKMIRCFFGNKAWHERNDAQVPAAEVRAALEMARSYIDATSTEPGYGFARPDNPHDFHPDAESCSADEIAAHKAACDAYDKGEYTPERGSEWVGAMHILRAPWGIGAYTMRDEQAVKVLAAIDNALAQQSTADKASEVRAEEWISVEDRLPEVGAWCNVLVDRELGDFFDRLNKPRYDVYAAQLRDIDSEGYASWQRWQMSDGGPMGLLTLVSHWIPLPNPPSTADSANKGEQA